VPWLIQLQASGGSLREGGEQELKLDLGAMEAMVSVWQQEGYEGHRGAPRVLLALLMRLGEISKNEKR